MTTFTAFKPPPNNAFSFQPFLDGQTCNAIVWWEVYGQRFYISVSLPDGTQLFNLPLIASPSAVPLQGLTWLVGGTVIGTTSAPHGFRQLATANLTISGCTPTDYNGVFSSFVDGKDTFRYKVATPLQDATQLGAVSYDFNIGAGYLQQSTLVFRESTQMFEVSP